jgi:hypothetical protein
MRSIPLVNSRLARAGEYLRVAYGQSGVRQPRLPQASPAASAGTVLAESDKLQQGLVAASVRMRRAGVVVLSASFDPGWTVTVDGRRQRTEMVALALVATTVPTGTHRIIFRYRGWQDYPLLSSWAQPRWWRSAMRTSDERDLGERPKADERESSRAGAAAGERKR